MYNQKNHTFINITITYNIRLKLDTTQKIKTVLQQTLPFPTDINRIIYHYTISELDINIQSDFEITSLERSHLLNTEYIDSELGQEEWVIQRSFEIQLVSNPDIISVEWSFGQPTIITESDLYWGNY